jgi:hypothetical protein
MLPVVLRVGRARRDRRCPNKQLAHGLARFCECVSKFAKAWFLWRQWTFECGVDWRERLPDLSRALLLRYGELF